MSDPAITFPARLRLPAYLLALVLLLFEAVVFWLMLHPDVSADYRAYYIDRSTTCLNQPVSGEYEPGSLVRFLPDNADALRPLRVCGWDGPAGDGLHAVGTTSRLRLVFDPAYLPAQPTLAIELAAVRKDDAVMPQNVDVRLNGQLTGTLRVIASDPQPFVLPLPPEALAAGRAELELGYPDAVQMGKRDVDTRYRSIKLTAAGILALPEAEDWARGR